MALSPTSSRSSGGSSVVTCLLARDAALSIRTAVAVPIAWDALYDNAVDFNALAAIPTGLGLSFLFNGTSATITTTAAGTWSFSYAISRNADATWGGQLLLAALARNYQLATNLTSGGVTDVATDVLRLPSGVAMVPTIDVQGQATANPYTASVYLSIVRLG